MKKKNRKIAILSGFAIGCLLFSLALFLIDVFCIKTAMISLPPAEGMTRADLYYLKPSGKPRAVLVYCPGINGVGDYFVESKEWQAFARENNLGLAGLSFASGEGTRDPAYYYAEKGSGDLLLSGLRRIYGTDLPLLLYGFSGGAHFTSHLVDFQPKRILAWCAYAGGTWGMTRAAKSDAPGLLACGTEDPRYEKCFQYYRSGREEGRNWSWLALPNQDHSRCPEMDAAVKPFFLRRLTQTEPLISLSDSALRR